MKNLIVIFLFCSILSEAFAIKGGNGKAIDRILHWVDDHSEDNVSECLDSLLKADRLSQKGLEIKFRVKVLLSLSRFSLVRLNNLERCHLYLEEVRKIAKARKNNPWILSQYHNGRGVMFFHEQSDRKRALQEFRKAQYLCKRFSLPKDPLLLNNYALVFLSSDQADKALRLFNEAAALSKNSKQDVSPRFVISNALNLGVCYIYLNDIVRAEQQFRKVLEIAKNTPSLNDDFEALVYLGVFQEEQGLTDEALSSLKAAEQLLVYSSSFQIKSLLSESLELIYSKRRMIELAYYYAKRKSLFLDSLREVKLSEQAFALDYKFEAQKLKDEKIISNLKNASERQNFKWRIILLITILLFVLLVGFFIIYRLNKMKELSRMKAEKEELDKERIRQQAEIDILRKEEELISANIELNVRKNELSDLKSRLQLHLDKSHDPEFDDLKTFLKQAQQSEKRAGQLKYLDHVLNYSNSAFYSNLRSKHPNLTDDELRLATLIRLNLGSEELLQVFNISMSSLMTKRYRMRKKMSLTKNVGLEEYIMML
jgi:hypothetical protein